MDLKGYTELFRTESRAQLAALRRALLAIEHGEDSAASVASMSRIVHTLKGMSATMGYMAVAEFSQGLESFLVGACDGKRTVTADVMNVLSAAADALEDGLEHSREGAVMSSAMLRVLERLHGIAGEVRTVHASVVALDALREAANIGAGHAATALSSLAGQRIIISALTINLTPLDDVLKQVGDAEEPVAAVAIRMEGDLSGLTLQVFPHHTARRIAALMLGGRPVHELGALEESALTEAGNILSAAYLNALAEFLGMRLLNSPPQLAIDVRDAVLSSTCVATAGGASHGFCVESEFQLHDDTVPLRGFFLLLPDSPSLRAMLDAIRVA